MKQLYFSITIIALILFSSCSDWLDVNPRSQIKADILFTTEDGYKSALVGVYIQMADAKLYGKNTSMYLPESFSRHWTIPSISSDNNTVSMANNITNKLSNFDYQYPDVETLINTTWSAYYNSIVQLNNILGNLENSQVEFSYNNDKLIKGEALGLRAFLHLDILRYFGPVPNANINLATPGIPYVTMVTKNPNELVSKSYQEVLSLIEKDLNEAEKLLLVDPILFNSNNDLNGLTTNPQNIPKDRWQLFRQNRFNYYAVLGTKARLYHWIGDNEKAVMYAKKVIEATDLNATTKFPLTTEAAYASSGNGNLVMLSEHLFSVHNPDLQAIVEPLFKNSDATLVQTVTAMNTAYESGVHANDIRYKANRYWEETSYQNSIKKNHFRKYTGNNLIKSNNLVPLLRLSEMYFIVIEDSPLSQAVDYFRAYRNARSLDVSLDVSLTDQAALMARLEKEYRKDFFGEGQMFFFYKKHDYKDYTWPAKFTLPKNALVIPIPKSQIAFE